MLPDKVKSHGSVSTYTNHRCRCEPCREAMKEYKRGYRYGLSQSEFSDLLATQEGACAICREAKPLSVDHCHQTNAVRGLLCARCNQVLGKFGDSAEILQRAINYLQGS